MNQNTRAQSTHARFPAEWEPQSAVLIAWPNADTDWADRLGEVEETYIALVAAITRFQDAIVCVADEDVEAYARARLSSARVDMAKVRFIEAPYDDTGCAIPVRSPCVTAMDSGCSTSALPAGAASSTPARTTSSSSASRKRESSRRVRANPLISLWKAAPSTPTATARC